MDPSLPEMSMKSVPFPPASENYGAFCKGSSINWFKIKNANPFIYFLSFPYPQSPEEAGGIKQDGGAGAQKVCSATEDSKSKISSNVSQESHEDSCDSEDPCAESQVEAAEGSERAQKAEVTLGQGENELDDTYPAPRLPYPCLSGLSIKEHKIYLDILKSKKPIAPPQVHSSS